MSELMSILQEVEMNFSRLYKNVAAREGQYDPKLKTAASVLSRQEKDHADAYAERVSALKKTGDLLLDAGYCEVAKKLLLDFKKEIQVREIGNVDELITFAVRYERLNAEMLGKLLSEVGGQTNPEIRQLLRALIDIKKEHSVILLSFKPVAKQQTTSTTME